MKYLKSLENPFLLGVHGFVLGAVLFFSGAVFEREAQAPVSAATVASAHQLPEA